jgi:hypothetical protein
MKLFTGRRARFLIGAGCAAWSLAAVCGAQTTSWGSYGGNAQHTGVSKYTAKPMERILWSTPVDLNPQYSGSSLLIHYGSPLITFFNTVIVTVKNGASDGFQVEARRGTDGTLLWTMATDYTLPPHGWTPSCGSTLTRLLSLATPGAGGTVFVRSVADDPNATVAQYPFYTSFSQYFANKATYDANVKICTPITSDDRGNLYFGFRVLGATPLNLKSGFAKITSTGAGTYIPADFATGDNSSQAAMNCTPAVSRDGRIVYVAANDGSFSAGYLLGLSTVDLHMVYLSRLKDPNSGNDAVVADDGTASPLVGFDNDVYFGVLENPFGSHHARGWLLHYDRTLSTHKIPGSFGWDDTASVVPSYAVASYHGPSSYLLLTKYNNYAGAGGDGVNKLGILDPKVSSPDFITGTPAMHEVLTVVGPTPDPEFVGPNYPNAVREWCINSAAIDPWSRCAIVNNEDGKAYRWDFATNSLTQTVTLTGGVGEAYTPTLLGPRGITYAINNARLYAIGRNSGP